MSIIVVVRQRVKQALRSVGGNEPAVAARLLGLLLVCGGLLTTAGVAVFDPRDSSVLGLGLIGGAAFALGGASLIWARHARTWSIHLIFAAGTGLVCAGIYFSGVVAGAYAVLFTWLVVIATSFFTPRAVVGHVAWILLASGVALAAVGDVDGVPIMPRWLVGSILLIVAAAVMSEVTAGRRDTEAKLRNEIEKRARLQLELEHLANHDPLTGLANRRRFEQELERGLGVAGRNRTPLCVMALDLDHLKQYNDAYGHAAGDLVLKHAAETWVGGLRAGDLLARTGGDEFVALMPDTDRAEAERVLERLRRQASFEGSFSAGIACWDGSESGEALLGRADRAMYNAKSAAAAAEIANSQPSPEHHADRE